MNKLFFMRLLKSFAAVMLAFCLLTGCAADDGDTDTPPQSTGSASVQADNGYGVSQAVDIEIGGTTATPCIVNTKYETADMVVADIVVTDAQYGADPTGQKDSTLAIRSALAKCGTLGGGTVWVPAGTYKISATLTVPPMVTLRGDWKDPDTVTDGEYGTVLSFVYTDNSMTAVNLKQNGGIMGMTVYYTEQKADAPVDLGWAIEFMGVEGPQAPVIENVTLLNAYDGIGLSADEFASYANSNMYLRNIKGTALNRGLVVNNNAGACSYEKITFSNKYWAKATAKFNAPSEKKLNSYTRKNAVAFTFGDTEMPLIYGLSASNYRYGIHVVKGKRMDFWGAGMAFLNITDTDIAFKIDAMMPGRMAGIVRSTLKGSEASIEINVENSPIHITDCVLSHPPKGGESVVSNPGTSPKSYEESSTPQKPSRAVLYNVQKAPYNAPCETVNLSAKLGGDCTEAIQKALNDAAKDGGGVVYLPAGYYSVKGNLDVPDGVELRGAGSSPMAPGPFGGTLVFLYAGKGSEAPETDTAGITVTGKNGGVRQLQFYYPENPYADRDALIAYPFAIRFLGAADSYGVNIMLSNPYLGIDVAAGSDRNFLRCVSGTASNGFIRVSNSKDCYVETIHDINPGAWTSSSRYGNRTRWMTDIFAYLVPHQKDRCNTVTAVDAQNLCMLNVMQYAGRCTLEAYDSTVEAWNLMLDQGGRYCVLVNSGKVTVMNSELTGVGYQVNGGDGELVAYNAYYIK